MKTKLSMERIRELDKVRDREVNACLQMGEHYSGPLPFFLHEKFIDATDLVAMARKWKVPIEDLRVYIAVQRYINEVARGDLEGLPLPEDIAGQLGIEPAQEFVDYVQEQVKLTKEAWTKDDDDDISPWRDVITEEWDGDLFEDDLLEDATRRGLCN